MHAVPLAMAQAAEKAGAAFRYGDAGRGDPAVPHRPGRRCRPGIRCAAACRRGGLHGRLAGGLRNAASRSQAARAAAAGALLAVGGGLACRRPWRTRTSGRAPQHPLWCAVGLGLRRAAEGRPADARPVSAGHRTVAGRADDGAAGLLDALRAGARAQPECRYRLDARGPGDARTAACFPRRAGLSERRGHRGTGNPAGLAAPGDGGAARRSP